MNLHIGEVNVFYANKKSKVQVPEVDTADLPRFSYFPVPGDKHPSNAEMTIPDVYAAIKSNKYKRQTDELRITIEPESARKYKAKNFDYVTFSGLFSKRKRFSVNPTFRPDNTRFRPYFKPSGTKGNFAPGQVL